MWSHHMYYEGERRTWIARTDVNRSLTLEIASAEPDIYPGDPVSLTTTAARPGATVKWWYSLGVCGATYISSLDLTLDIGDAV